MRNKHNLRTANTWRTMRTYALIMGVMLMSSCELDDVLDKKPTDSYSDAAVWNDEPLVQAFVNNVYREVPFGFQHVIRILPYSFMVDENNARASAASAGPITRGEYGPSYSGPMDVWTDARNRSLWVPIKLANEFLEKIGGTSIDKDLEERFTAEIRVLRAYAYFHLISQYGGVPLITRTFSLGDDFRVARNTYDEVMDFIITELEEAMVNLPNEYTGADVGRLTRGAAMAIKSRALLYAASPLNNPENDLAKWQAASDAAKAVIDLNQYALFDDYRTLFTESGGYNVEVIWARPMNNAIDREARIEQLLFPNSAGGFAHVNPYQNLVDDFETINGLLPENDPDYDSQNPYVNRDPRFYATILYDGAPFKDRTVETFIPGGRDSHESPSNAWNATETGYYVRKFITDSESGNEWEGTSDPMWIRFRYAEILLNYAEARFMLGDEEGAREYLNKVRSRPGVQMPDVTDSGQALWDRIVNERRIELVFEAHRFFDVRRWKIAEQVLSEDRTRMLITRNPDTGEKTYTVEFFQEAQFYERNYLAPIPQTEIEKNELLEQNPGY